MTNYLINSIKDTIDDSASAIYERREITHVDRVWLDLTLIETNYELDD